MFTMDTLSWVAMIILFAVIAVACIGAMFQPKVIRQAPRAMATKLPRTKKGGLL